MLKTTDSLNVLAGETILEVLHPAKYMASKNTNH
tara:strand:+ start:562 stop:663 length:102 start_codon:yes stop_codon:yes gene_type:complete